MSVDKQKFEKLVSELQQKGILGLKVVSGSMEPIIRTGQNILVGQLPHKGPRRFDIVVFWDGTRMICHYLWHLNQPHPGVSRLAVTRSLYGSEDFPVQLTHILGKVISHRLPWWLKTRLVLAALLRKR